MTTQPGNSDRPLHVLVIDDDAATRDIFRMVLEHHHFSVDVAETAHAGLDFLATAAAPDVIVIDIFLPDQDGYQMMRELRKRGVAPNTSIVATTSYYTMDTATEVTESGFDGYLPKPINSQKLPVYLTEMCRNHQAS